MPIANPFNNTDANVGRNQIAYPLEDPDTAFRNALQDEGFNPYKSNPFVQSLQRSARGLRTAYVLREATGGVPGNQAGSNNGQNPSAYQDFLRSTIRNGHIAPQLQQSYAQLQNGVQAIRNYQSDLAAGRTTAAQANPYLALLSDELSANNGQGTANAMTYLRAPLLGAQLGRSYSDLLGDIVSQANRTFANDPASYEPGTNRDIWSYIFGSAGSPF